MDATSTGSYRIFTGLVVVLGGTRFPQLDSVGGMRMARDCALLQWTDFGLQSWRGIYRICR
jgi:hypothetical protein